MPDLHLDLHRALDREELLAPAVRAAIVELRPDLAGEIRVAPIDATLSDTAEFCAAYGVLPEDSANCIVVVGKRGETISHAACVVLATTRLDVNGVVRRLLDARTASFAPMADAVRLTAMEYGGISPIGIPAGWRLLIDARVVARDRVIVGAGLRAAKISLPGSALAALPGAEVVDGLAVARE